MVEEGNFTHINVELYYHKGGLNYFTSCTEKRGYYLSVKPLNKSTNSVSYIGFSGVKELVKEAGRYSSKILNEFVIDYELMNRMVEHVAKKNNIKLKELHKESEMVLA